MCKLTKPTFVVFLHRLCMHMFYLICLISFGNPIFFLSLDTAWGVTTCQRAAHHFYLTRVQSSSEIRASFFMLCISFKYLGHEMFSVYFCYGINTSGSSVHCLTKIIWTTTRWQRVWSYFFMILSEKYCQICHTIYIYYLNPNVSLIYESLLICTILSTLILHKI